MKLYTNEERPERAAALSWIHNPAAPQTEDELQAITKEAARILNDALSDIEEERRVPC